MPDRPAAETLAALVAELLDEVRTREPIVGHRRERRGQRTISVPHLTHWRTREPGLIDQLEAVAYRPGDRLVRVPVMTTEKTAGPGGRPVRRRVPMRVPVTDWRGRPMMRAQWDGELRRTVLVPVTTPVTELRRAAAEGLRSARPGAGMPGGSAGWDADGALAPGRRGTAEGRAPTTEALDALLQIHHQARRLYARMLSAAAAADGPDPTPRRGLDALLRHLVGLATAVDAHTAAAAVSAVRSWVTGARTVIGYEAPILHLRDICCPECGGRLAVRSDGSTPVWCTGIRRYHGPALEGAPWPMMGRCHLSYPRSTWLDLFTPGETEPTPAAPRRRPHSLGRIEGMGGRAPTQHAVPTTARTTTVPAVLAGLYNDPTQEDPHAR